MTAIYRPPGWGPPPPMIDGDEAKAAIHGHAWPFEEDAGRLFADFAGSAPLDQPVKESIEAIASVPQRHGVTLAGA